jgi:hypothetical protein
MSVRFSRVVTQQAVADDQQIEEAGRRRSTDARGLGPGDRLGMSPEPLSQPIPKDSLTYAESLYSYASSRLDAFSLRCWIIQRLMVDDGLEHESAERAFEYARDIAREASVQRAACSRRRRIRRPSFAIGRHATSSLR